MLHAELGQDVNNDITADPSCPPGLSQALADGDPEAAPLAGGLAQIGLSLGTFLLGMGALALALAAMGIYGVMAHSVVQQQREIGIRMALGARRRAVVLALARSGLGLVAVGAALGLPIVLLMFRGTSASLTLFNARVGFTYPVAFGATLLAVAVLATLLPAGRASGIAPVAALRE